MLWFSWKSKELACPQAQGGQHIWRNEALTPQEVLEGGAVRPSSDLWEACQFTAWGRHQPVLGSAFHKDLVYSSPAVSNQSLYALLHASLTAFWGGRQGLMSIIFSFFHLEYSPKVKNKAP